jgi:hypothetical protein
MMHILWLRENSVYRDLNQENKFSAELRYSNDNYIVIDKDITAIIDENKDYDINLYNYLIKFIVTSKSSPLIGRFENSRFRDLEFKGYNLYMYYYIQDISQVIHSIKRYCTCTEKGYEVLLDCLWCGRYVFPTSIINKINEVDYLRHIHKHPHDTSTQVQGNTKSPRNKANSSETGLYIQLYITEHPNIHTDYVINTKESEQTILDLLDSYITCYNSIDKYNYKLKMLGVQPIRATANLNFKTGTVYPMISLSDFIKHPANQSTDKPEPTYRLGSLNKGQIKLSLGTYTIESIMDYNQTIDLSGINYSIQDITVTDKFLEFTDDLLKKHFNITKSDIIN